jgi:hypothetical protein
MLPVCHQGLVRRAIYDLSTKGLFHSSLRILSRIGVTYKTGFGLDDWIYFTLYIHTVRVYRQYSAIADLHTFQSTVAHTLGFSIFTNRIPATDLSQSHCHFKSHMKSSFHNPIPFLPFFLYHLGLPSPELDPILSNTLLYSLLPCFYYSCPAEHFL